jgi:hypothetical protein
VVGRSSAPGGPETSKGERSALPSPDLAACGQAVARWGRCRLMIWDSTGAGVRLAAFSRCRCHTLYRYHGRWHDGLPSLSSCHLSSSPTSTSPRTACACRTVERVVPRTGKRRISAADPQWAGWHSHADRPDHTCRRLRHAPVEEPFASTSRIFLIAACPAHAAYRYTPTHGSTRTITV